MSSQSIFSAEMVCCHFGSFFSNERLCEYKKLFLLPLIGQLIGRPFLSSFELTNQLMHWPKLQPLLSCCLQNWDVLSFGQVFHQWKVVWIQKNCSCCLWLVYWYVSHFLQILCWLIKWCTGKHHFQHCSAIIYKTEMCCYLSRFFINERFCEWENNSSCRLWLVDGLVIHFN